MSHAEESAAPRRKPWRQRPWKVRYLTYVGVFLGLLVLAYVIIDVRGRLRWKAHVAKIEAAGGSLNLLELIQDPATEESFWSDPFVRELMEGGVASFQEPFSADPEHNSDHHYHAEFGLIHRTNWQFARPNALATFFPNLTLTREQAALRLLKDLEPLRENLEKLAAAVKRPRSAYPWKRADFEEFGDSELRQDRVFAVSSLLRIRSICYLETGDAEAALADIETALALAGHAGHEGLLSGTDWRIMVFESSFQPIWEGLNRRVWDDRQLARLDAALAACVNGAPSVEDVMERQRCFGNALIEETMISYSSRWRNAIGDEWLGPPPNWVLYRDWIDSAFAWTNRAFFTALPTGVIRENQIFEDELTEATLLNPALSLADQLAAQEAALDKIAASPFRNLDRFFNQSRLELGFASMREHDQLLETIRAAVAAERYWLARKSYPKTWSDLVPEWLSSIPKDVWSGGDQIYRLGPEGRPVIYSVGWNEVDDGGTPHIFFFKGDRVWRYSLPPGLTR